VNRPTSTLRGVATMSLGFFLLGLQPVFLKLALEGGFSTAAVVALRFAISLSLVVPIALVTHQSLRTEQPIAWLLRGVLGGLAVLLFFESVRLAGAGVGTLLNYTYPIWANLLSFLAGERPSRMIWLALPLAICGTALVVAPTGSGAVGRGELCGLISAAFGGGAIICIKRLRRTDGELTIIASFSLIGLILALPALALPELAQPGLTLPGLAQPGPTQPAGPEPWLFAMAVGLLSFYGHVYFTRGYKETSIQLGTVLSLMVPALAAAGGFVFLGERLAPTALLGAGLIAGAVLLIAVREHMARASAARTEDSA